MKELLLKWYRKNKRSLPWREIRDPYRVWVSEIILQQTRIAQGLSYYHAFLKAFPDLSSLADAAEERILKVWQGLGYYSRARNMHKAAKFAIAAYNGRLPVSYGDWLRMPGVGEYTAAAVTSICHGEVVPVLDGNVYRVVSRYLSLEDPAGSTLLKRKCLTFLRENIDSDSPGDFNQAMMELGALVCTPQQPACAKCPLSAGCAAFRESSQEAYPVKKATRVVPDVFMVYRVYVRKDAIWITKREGSGIWQGLYEFPGHSFETPGKARASMRKIRKQYSGKVKEYGPVTHLLTHKRLFLFFLEIQIEGKDHPPEEKGKFVRFSNLRRYPFPVPLAAFLDERKA